MDPYFDENLNAAPGAPVIDLSDPYTDFLQQFIMAAPTTSDISFPIKQQGPVCYLFSAALCIYYSHLRPKIDKILQGYDPGINQVLLEYAGPALRAEMLNNNRKNTLDTCNTIYHFIHAHVVDFDQLPNWVKMAYRAFLNEQYTLDEDGKNGGYVEIALWTLINSCGIPCMKENLIILDYDELEEEYDNNNYINFGINPYQPVILHILSEQQTYENNDAVHPLGVPKYVRDPDAVVTIIKLLLDKIVAIGGLIRSYYVKYNDYRISNLALGMMYHSLTRSIHSHCIFVSYTYNNIFVIDGNIGKVMGLEEYIHYMFSHECYDMFITSLSVLVIPINHENAVNDFLDEMDAEDEFDEALGDAFDMLDTDGIFDY
ncbi:hypothetical protein EXVG_00417 [Emiliania huxleyi virus 202]|nr:hypothetical protein EXVG_00417 [Emiliania huxleyi virus 202]AHA54375.1 hypothetical protein EhV18_00329 [Emiliania huxleyi virus 18]AHA55414.1 hypothetical protein EhV156_00319 [Emiliania huxleyi virus 156]